MKHLSPQEFIDGVDGRIDAARQAHLATCDSCRGEIEALRAALGEAGAVSVVPEPSPLFWDHFARRVREATADVPMAGGASWWRQMWRPAAVWATCAASALALAIGLRPAPVDRPVDTPIALAEADMSLLDDNDSSVDVMSAVAGELTWDEVQASSLTPSRATVDLAVARLTEAQRQELIRLLRAEISGLE